MAERIVLEIDFHTGTISGLKVPAGVEIEVRDYGVPDDFEGQTANPDWDNTVEVDDDGDRYQRITIRGKPEENQIARNRDKLWAEMARNILEVFHINSPARHDKPLSQCESALCRNWLQEIANLEQASTEEVTHAQPI